MQLITYQLDHHNRLGVLQDKKVIDIQLAYLEYCHAKQNPVRFDHQFDSLTNWLKDGEDAKRVISEVVRFVATPSLQEQYNDSDLFLDPEKLTLLAPIPSPGKVICIAGNYPAAGKLSAPDYPIVFLKPSSSVTGPGMPIWLSEMTTSVAYEVELAVVIAKRARKVGIPDAVRYIGGYTLANDLGDRLLEKRTSQWTSGKMFDSFTPLGPVLVTPEELPDLQSLQMGAWVNDQQVQKGTVGEMFFAPDTLVSYVSHLTTLEPGDVILTGSPKLMDGEQAPVVSLKPGDTVRVAIRGLGELSNPVREEQP
jgi:acylpyruvate hydrolase